MLIESPLTMKTNPQHHLRYAALFIVATLLSGCATNDKPPCRRVDAKEFMRPHTFKGIATDRFIGVTKTRRRSHSDDDRKAFKEIWELGLIAGWAVLWIPAKELPDDYLANAYNEPNRPSHRVMR